MSAFVLPDRARALFDGAFAECSFPFDSPAVVSRVHDVPVRWGGSDFPYAGLWDGANITLSSDQAAWWESDRDDDVARGERRYGQRNFLHETGHMIDQRVLDPLGLRPALMDLLDRAKYPTWGEGNYGDQASEAFARVFVAAFAPTVHDPPEAEISPGLFPDTDPACIDPIRELIMEALTVQTNYDVTTTESRRFADMAIGSGVREIPVPWAKFRAVTVRPLGPPFGFWVPVVGAEPAGRNGSATRLVVDNAWVGKVGVTVAHL